MLFKFLYRNLRGYRFLVFLAIIVTVSQVGADILAATPLKFIPSKVANAAADPACTFPILDGPLNFFNQFDTALNRPAGQPRALPPALPCPGSKPGPTSHPQITQHSTIAVIIFSGVLLLIFGVLSAMLAYVQLYLASFVAQHLSERLRRNLFEHLQRLSLDWHGKQKKGDLVQRVTGNIADIEKLVTDGLVDLLAGVLTLVGVAAVMVFVSPQYTLLSLAIAPALFMIVVGYTRSIKKAAKKASKAAGQVADVATEDINALTVIRAFTLEEREDLRFKRYVGLNRAAGLRAGGLQAQFTPVVAILIAAGTTIIIGVGGYVAAGHAFSLGVFTIAAGSVDIGTLVLFLTYLKMLYQPMRDLSKLTNLASSAGSGAERIQEVLDQAPEVTENQAPYYGPTKLRGAIEFENVVFGYTPEHPILKGINLQIPAGRKVALVGLSGGGKTTLVKLIPRFYEIQKGSVRIDGADNRMYPLNILRQNVSMVLQDSVLFEGTIRENIEIGRPGATDAEIIDSAKKAQIHETITALPDGYETLVREQGKNFSGGQRQRLAIARAILRDAPILILDEPTASLDVEAEAEVMHALDKLVIGRTVLMISHRLSTLGSVDEIIVLKEGKIVEQGNYKELKKRGGIFANLLEEQNRYNVEREGDKSILRSAFVQIQPIREMREVPPSPQPMSHRNPAGKLQPPPPVPIPVHIPQQANGGQQQSAAISPIPAQSRSNYNGPMRAKNARILVEYEGKVISERLLDKPVLTIGRLSDNDIAIPHQRVSRLHARIRAEDGIWLLEDADSVNGITYHGKRIDRLPLSNGDKVYIAPTVLLHYQAQS
ncbi:MAG TPA: ABC transporter transmembrane domain-containing protein [Ktedonobacteraceae bacterium]|nr:ABC transporter transmembrane domain-containing protein [Ktedonobacteraceae bacterium]